MLKKSLCLLSLLMSISVLAFAEEEAAPFDVTVQYHASCHSKKYEECAKNNKEILLEALLDVDSKIKDVKEAVFEHENKTDQFKPDNQVLTCGEYWPSDEDYVDMKCVGMMS